MSNGLRNTDNLSKANDLFSVLNAFVDNEPEVACSIVKALISNPQVSIHQPEVERMLKAKLPKKQLEELRNSTRANAENVAQTTEVIVPPAPIRFSTRSEEQISTKQEDLSTKRPDNK